MTAANPDGMMPPREGLRMERRGSRLSRRQFVVGAAGAAMAGTDVVLLANSGRLTSQAGSPRKVPRIGFLLPLSPQTTGPVAWFDQGLRELGYVEGRNI